ncbi:IclR family transcriptional regulator [Streptomyces sp. NPDC005438]|uniref:IclR family transcriptional regulator n=1 Tax=Streptomyces sp. NPDC005438 TaxID=3156880 RepID=UPI0033B389DE
MAEAEAAEGPSSTRRTLAILTALGTPEAAERGGLRVVEIAELVGREKSQISRALKALHQAGMVERDPDTLLYRLGWRMFALAANAGHPRLLAIAPPVLRRLVMVLGERAHITVLTTDGALTVLSESPQRSVQAVGWVGRTTPVHCTSSGRALLFDHHDHEVRDLCADVPFSPGEASAPRDVEELLGRLRDARERGYALADEEFEPGLLGLAAPVRDFRGRVLAALNVSAPRYRVGREPRHLARAVTGAARQISRAMAGQPLNGPTRTSPTPRSAHP